MDEFVFRAVPSTEATLPMLTIATMEAALLTSVVLGPRFNFSFRPRKLTISFPSVQPHLDSNAEVTHDT